jgi:hypothetical protein
MNSRCLPATLLLSFLLTGCATFNDSELGIIRGSGVSPRVYTKMEAGRVLTPEDVIELTRRRVPERYILRQIDDAGVDYVLSPEDHKQLQQARVSPAVIDALIMVSDEFSDRYAAPRYRVYGPDPYPYYYDDYYGPRLYPRVGGSVGIGFTTSHGHWHHRH